MILMYHESTKYKKLDHKVQKTNITLEIMFLLEILTVKFCVKLKNINKKSFVEIFPNKCEI